MTPAPAPTSAPATPGAGPWNAPAAPAPSGKHAPLYKLSGRLRRIQIACGLRWAVFCVELWLMSVLALACLWGLAGLAWEITPATHHAIRDGIAVLLGLGTLSAMVLVVAKVPTKREIGAYLEQFEPGFKGSLLTSIEALRPAHSVPRAVVELSAERAERILRLGVGRAAYPRLPWRRVHSGMLGAMAVTLCAVALGGPAFFEAFLRGMFPVAPVVRMLGPRLVEIRPGPAQVLEGSLLNIEGRYEGPPADRVWIEFLSEHGEARSLACTRAPGAEAEVWQGALGPLSTPGQYRVLAQRGAASTEPVASAWFPITVLPRSTVQSIALYIEPPAYTGIAPWKETNPAAVTAPLGSRLILYVSAGPVEDLASGSAEIPGAKKLELKRLAEADAAEDHSARFGAHFTLEQAGMLRVQFESADAERPGPSALVTLAVLPDRPPEADVAVSSGATPTKDGLAMDVRLSDDFGLQSARMLIRPLPPEPGRVTPNAPQVTAVGLPVRAGQREWRVRWMLPRAELEALFRAGFLYQVEAFDNAQPTAQAGRSAWKRWEPNQNGGGNNEQAGLLEKPERRLTRKNALNSVPDFNLDQLGQLGNVGAGKPANNGTPKPERLDGKKESSPDQPNGSGESGSGAGKPNPGKGDRSEYDNPYRTQPKNPEQPNNSGEKNGPVQGGSKEGAQGEKPGEKSGGKPNSKSKPEDGKGENQPGSDAKHGEGSGGTGSGQGERGASGNKGGTSGAGNAEGSNKSGSGAQGQERKSGGKSPSGSGQPGEGKSGEGTGTGNGASSGGAEVGREKGSTGQGDAPDSPPEPGSGKNGLTPRDGGHKTGKEIGLSKGEMAPADLNEVSKMKSASTEEVRSYTSQHSVKGGRTDFGGSESAKPEDAGRGSDVAPVTLGKVQLSEADSQRDPKNMRLDGVPKARAERIDPIFKPLVDSYLMKLQQLRREAQGSD